MRRRRIAATTATLASALVIACAGPSANDPMPIAVDVDPSTVRTARPGNVWAVPPLQTGSPLTFDVHVAAETRGADDVAFAGSCEFALTLEVNDERLVVRQGPVRTTLRELSNEASRPFYAAALIFRCQIADAEIGEHVYEIDQQGAQAKVDSIREAIQRQFESHDLHAVGATLASRLDVSVLEDQTFVLLGLFGTLEGRRLQFGVPQEVTYDDETPVSEYQGDISVVEWVDEIPCPYTPGACAVVELRYQLLDAGTAYEELTDELRKDGIRYEVRAEQARVRLVVQRSSGILQQAMLFGRRDSRFEAPIIGDQGYDMREDVVVYEFIPAE